MGPLDSPGRATAAEERIARVFAQDTIERLFEFSPDAILVADGDGVMRAANPARRRTVRLHQRRN